MYSYIIFSIFVSVCSLTVVFSDKDLPDLQDVVFTEEDRAENFMGKDFNSTEKKPFLAKYIKYHKLSANTTEANLTQRFAQCIPTTDPPVVQKVNDTELIKLLVPLPNITNREKPAKCTLVLFYSQYCPFSSVAAPHFNALPRAFPEIKMVAINAMKYQLINTQNGIMGVPTLVLYHNGKAVGRYNDSEYSLELFSKFITRHTLIPAQEKAVVTSADFSGPVTSTPVQQSDSLLIVSWVFIITCAIYYFTKSKWWRWIVETIQSNWRDSAHEHTE